MMKIVKNTTLIQKKKLTKEKKTRLFEKTLANLKKRH